MFFKVIAGLVIVGLIWWFIDTYLAQRKASRRMVESRKQLEEMGRDLASAGMDDMILDAEKALLLRNRAVRNKRYELIEEVTSGAEKDAKKMIG